MDSYFNIQFNSFLCEMFLLKKIFFYRVGANRKYSFNKVSTPFKTKSQFFFVITFQEDFGTFHNFLFRLCVCVCVCVCVYFFLFLIIFKWWIDINHWYSPLNINHLLCKIWDTVILWEAPADEINFIFLRNFWTNYFLTPYHNIVLRQFT